VTTATAQPETAAIDLAVERRALTRASKLTDPVARAERTGDIAFRAQAAADATRTPRDQATAALFVFHGWAPRKVYRHAGVTRSLFHRIIQRNEKRGIDPAYKDAEHAERVAGELAGVPESLAALAKAARDVRDPAILELVDPPHSMSNVDIAALAKMTGQRIAQMKTEREALRVACPACDAAVGERCRKSDGSGERQAHPARLNTVRA